MPGNPVVTFSYNIPVPAPPTVATDSFHKIYFRNMQILLDMGPSFFYDIDNFFIENL